MLNEDWKEKPPLEYYSLEGKWRPIRAIFSQCRLQYAPGLCLL